jgi:hypothetical protein
VEVADHADDFTGFNCRWQRPGLHEDDIAIRRGWTYSTSMRTTWKLAPGDVGGFWATRCSDSDPWQNRKSEIRDLKSGRRSGRACLLNVCVVAVLLAGCVSKPRNTLTLDPVGPLTGAAVGAFTRPTGYLEVYTATEPYDDGGFVYYRQTPYSVYDDKGRRVKSVVNRVGMTDQRPMTVPLPAGEYRVYAQAEGFGIVEVPVVIVGTRLTEVHLERGGIKDPSQIPENARVQLPDGRTVGRRGERASGDSRR